MDQVFTMNVADLDSIPSPSYGQSRPSGVIPKLRALENVRDGPQTKNHNFTF